MPKENIKTQPKLFKIVIINRLNIRNKHEYNVNTKGRQFKKIKLRENSIIPKMKTSLTVAKRKLNILYKKIKTEIQILGKRKQGERKKE